MSNDPTEYARAAHAVAGELYREIGLNDLPEATQIAVINQVRRIMALAGAAGAGRVARAADAQAYAYYRDAEEG